MGLLEDLFKDLPNPFTTDYLQQEIDFYEASPYRDGNGIEVRMVKLNWINRLDDYLNKALRFEKELPSVPILYIDGKLWMSLSWMEVQSMFCPIELAAGDVGTAGLGMGYFALRVAEKDEVDSVEVYEIEPRVIQYFTQRFKDREYFKKIKVVEGNARKEMRGKRYDYFFSDIYRNIWDGKTVGDIALFSKYNEIESYGFWGLEKALLGMIILDRTGFTCFEQHNPFDAPICDLYFIEKWFFSAWLKSDGANLHDRWYVEAKHRYIKNVLKVLKEWRMERNFS